MKNSIQYLEGKNDINEEQKNKGVNLDNSQGLQC